jgi:hypothetical protein
MSFFERVSSVVDNGKGAPPMMLGPLNAYDSSDENTSIVKGLKEVFIESDRYEISSKSK